MSILLRSANRKSRQEPDLERRSTLISWPIHAILSSLFLLWRREKHPPHSFNTFRVSIISPNLILLSSKINYGFIDVFYGNSLLRTFIGMIIFTMSWTNYSKAENFLKTSLQGYIILGSFSHQKVTTAVGAGLLWVPKLLDMYQQTLIDRVSVLSLPHIY